MNLPISSMKEGKFADDPVIPKGSPLQEYLNSLCLNDDGYVSGYFEKKQDKYEIKSNKWYKDSIKAFMARKWIWVRGMLSSVFPISKSVVREVCQNYYYQYGEEIVRSKIILDEDLDFLCLQTPQIFVDIVRKDKKSAVNKTPQQENNKLNMFVLSALVVLCLSILLEAIISPYLRAAIFMFVFIFIIFNVRLKITKEIWKRKLHSNLSIMKDLLTCSFKFLSISTKCIRMAQELEVVSLGYRLVNGSTPATRLEQSVKNKDKRRSCERLRSLLLRTTIQIILICREATLQLITYLPPADSTPHTRFNISHEILENLHPCLIATDDMELYEASDGYSLASLKSLNILLRKQISEFTTHLFIALSSCTWDFSTDGLLVNLIHVLSDPLQTMNKSVKSVGCCYEMHKFVTNKMMYNKQTNTNTAGKHEHNSNKKKNEISSAFLIHLHSLQVHMRNAILMSIEMEERLKKNDGDDESYATGLLDNIEHHISVATDCFVKCSSELQQKHDDDVIDDVITATKMQQPTPSVIDNKVECINNIQEDDYMEDQVFEAVVVNDADEQQNMEDDEQVDNNTNQQREQSTNLMRELKSVLAVKTSVQEREERKKKLFPTYKPKQQQEENEEGTNIRNMFSFYTDQCDVTLNYTSLPFKRPPGCAGKRRPCSKSRRVRSSTTNEEDLFQQQQINKQQQQINKQQQHSDSDDDDDDRRIGFGFSHSIAAQAAAMAKQRSAMNLPSEVIGDETIGDE